MSEEVPVASRPVDPRRIVVRGPDDDPADLEYELKFTLAAGRACAAAAWLRMVCRVDEQHPEADVWTIYYDTAGWRSLDEKRNSDYLKTKLRVRWYSRPGQPPSGPAFVEAKSRIGSRRIKVRSVLPWTAEEMASRPLSDRAFAGLTDHLPEFLWPAGSPWSPVLQLRYRRRRFVEPMAGARVSLDDDIALTAFNPARLSPCNLGPLPLAVLEVKGHDDRLPIRLGAMLHLGARRMSMSKYAAVWEQARRHVS